MASLGVNEFMLSKWHCLEHYNFDITLMATLLRLIFGAECQSAIYFMTNRFHIETTVGKIHDADWQIKCFSEDNTHVLHSGLIYWQVVYCFPEWRTLLLSLFIQWSDWLTSSLVHLTHWGRVTHICVSTQTIIGSDNGLSPGRRQAIIWISAGILLIGPLGANFNEIVIEIDTFSFKKMHLKMSSGIWGPFCLGLHVLTIIDVYHVYMYHTF